MRLPMIVVEERPFHGRVRLRKRSYAALKAPLFHGISPVTSRIDIRAVPIFEGVNRLGFHLPHFSQDRGNRAPQLFKSSSSVILSEISASHSEADMKSKDPTLLALLLPLTGILTMHCARGGFPDAPLPRRRTAGPSTPQKFTS